jgi:uncharacterized protein YhhL (DUF1145 family)
MSRLGLARIATRALWAACVVLFVTGTPFTTLAWPLLIVSAGELAIFCAENPERLHRRVGRREVLQALFGVSAILALGVAAATLWQ